jgi:hypothetical protein
VDFIYDDAYRTLTANYLASSNIPPEWRSYYQNKGVDLANEVYRITVGAIDSAITDTGVGNRLRSDAYHVMVVNLRENWILPRLTPRAVERGINVDALLSDIAYAARQDALTLLRQAGRQASEDGEITGHAIIQAIDTAWGDLRGSLEW